MNKKKVEALLIIVVLFATSIIVAVWGLWSIISSRLVFEEYAFLVLFFAFVISIAASMEVRFSDYSSIAMDSFFIIGAILNLPFFLAALSVFLGEVIAETLKKKPLVRKIFAVSQFTSNAAFTGFILNKSVDPGVYNLNFLNLLLFVFVGVVFFLINTLIHSLVVSLHENLRTVDLWLMATPGKINFLPLIGMTVMGILFAYLAPRTFAGALLSLFPLYLLYSVFKKTAMLEETLKGVLNSMVTALEAKDPYTADHSKRVSEYSRKISEKMGLPLTEIKCIEQAALLHDLGKIGTPDEVLYKPGKLSLFEWKLITQHPVDGNFILASIPLLKEIKNYVLHHHERADGTGYPFKKASGEILLGAQIIAIADAYDAMRSPRPYRRPFTIEEAFKELSQGKPYQFNSDIITELRKVVAENPHLEERPIPVCPLPPIELSEVEERTKKKSKKETSQI